MANVAIHVEGLSKSYQLGQRRGYDTLRDSLAAATGALFHGRRGESQRKTIWALDDVSFEVEAGEVLGVIGRNGAGKTTLLKILSRITEPTRGLADIHGRLGSLLEVGTGFHPELTGRENISLNGAILGMRRTEIARKFDDIVEFAGVSEFIDTPVKRYSSGMYVRLAFSVAAHLEPEILLVDEVLAVGDAEFQKRCLGKMQEIGKSGRTVLFVSHSMPTVTRLCDRVIMLEKGAVAADGPAIEVVSRYLTSDQGAQSIRRWDELATAPGDDLVRLTSVRIVDEDRETVDAIDVRRPVGIEIAFTVLKDGDPFRPQIMLVNEQGVHAFNAMDTNPRWHHPTPVGEHLATAWIPANFLNEGLMTITVFLSTLASGRTLQHVLERDVVSFQVVDPVEGDSAKGNHSGQWYGGVRPKLEWDARR